MEPIKNNVEFKEENENMKNTFVVYFDKLSKFNRTPIFENFNKTYKSEIKIVINSSSLVMFFYYSIYKKRLFFGIKNSLALFIFNSLFFCRDNLNPYSKYRK